MTVGRIPSVEGGIQPTLLDAKGDLITATAADTPARLALGTTGQVLKVNTATATGLEWAADSAGMTNPMTTTGDTIYSSSGSTPARLGIGSSGQVLTVSSGIPAWTTISSGGLTVISSTTFNSTSGTVDISSIPSTYKELLITAIGLQSTVSTDESVRVRFNNDTGGNYSLNSINISNTLAAENGNGETEINTGNNVARTADASNRFTRLQISIPNYASTEIKAMFFTSGGIPNGTQQGRTGSAGWNNTSAINRITLYLANGNFKDGILTVYGVS
jgi:hypothetical protein